MVVLVKSILEVEIHVRSCYCKYGGNGIAGTVGCHVSSEQRPMWLFNNLLFGWSHQGSRAVTFMLQNLQLAGF